MTAVSPGGVVLGGVVVPMAESAERAELASIVQSSHDAIIGMTRDGVVTSWNPAAARLYGYPAGEIIGQPADMFVPAELREMEAEIRGRIANGEEMERY